MTEFDLDSPDLYLNRELSWLDFNDRVLAEAHDHRNPLLERVRFLAITANNLDEFYSKRVGWLKRLLSADPSARSVDGMTVTEQTPLTLERCHEMIEEMDELWARELEPALAEIGVAIVPLAELDEPTRRRLSDQFVESILPVLTPLVVDPAHPFPFISGGSLSLMLEIREHGSSTRRFARVKVPPNRPRFVPAGEGRFVMIEDLIGSHLDLLFRGASASDWHLAHIIRSIDLDEPSEAAQDLRELMERELERRRFADAVALEVTASMPDGTTQLLLDELRLGPMDVTHVQRLIGKADLHELADLPLSEHHFAQFSPATPRSFENIEDGPSFFAAMRERDILVHHPYESFDASAARFAAEAAADPDVLAIKQTIYRTSPDSPMLESLIYAASRGKQVAVVVELSARLDEANNLAWAQKLEDAGVHIAYGQPSQKVHSKLTLVVREEPTGVRMYAHIGTGNYNSRTARVYTDFGLFTADAGVCDDLVHIFNDLTGYSDEPITTHLLVAPYTLREELVRRTRREIELARAGRPARLMFKMNGLEDRDFVRLLYEASQAGVQVDLVVRGICRLRPGIEGLSDNIRVVSVIGRFLEHSRIYWFCNDGAPEVFIGSADAMKRNLDERIEVLTPIFSAVHRRQLEHVMELQLCDERQGWTLRDRDWTRDESSQAEGSQAVLLREAPFGASS